MALTGPETVPKDPGAPGTTASCVLHRLSPLFTASSCLLLSFPLWMVRFMWRLSLMSLNLAAGWTSRATGCWQGQLKYLVSLSHSKCRKQVGLETVHLIKLVTQIGREHTCISLDWLASAYVCACVCSDSPAARHRSWPTFLTWRLTHAHCRIARMRHFSTLWASLRVVRSWVHIWTTVCRVCWHTTRL